MLCVSLWQFNFRKQNENVHSFTTKTNPILMFENDTMILISPCSDLIGVINSLISEPNFLRAAGMWAVRFGVVGGNVLLNQCIDSMVVCFTRNTVAVVQKDVNSSIVHLVHFVRQGWYDRESQRLENSKVPSNVSVSTARTKGYSGHWITKSRHCLSCNGNASAIITTAILFPVLHVCGVKYFIYFAYYSKRSEIYSR